MCFVNRGLGQLAGYHSRWLISSPAAEEVSVFFWGGGGGGGGETSFGHHFLLSTHRTLSHPYLLTPLPHHLSILYVQNM